VPQIVVKIACLSNEHVVFQWLYEKIAVVKDLAGKSWRRLRSMLAGKFLRNKLVVLLQLLTTAALGY